MPHAPLITDRLKLVPVTVAIVEAVLTNRREVVEALLEARLPNAWPGRALIERAFWASLDNVRANPEVRLWGDRVMITIEAPYRIVGSVVFHGAPHDEGVVEVAYGVEEESQGRGYATEAVNASVRWALEHPGVTAVRATTPPWHVPSRRVLEKCGFCEIGTREGDAFGELLELERTRR
ncbi:MAG: GNAT family N-acetyltransferase [Polyangiaceae bacterium]|nr:GNAT family N-acetyltransferase [Polyangiaceae bacterium]